MGAQNVIRPSKSGFSGEKVFFLDEIKYPHAENSLKMWFFDDFSKSLQRLRYYFGHENTWNQTYLKGFGRNLRPRTWFSHQHLLWEISQLWPESPLRAIISPYPPKVNKKRFFRWFFKLPPKSKVLFWTSKHIESNTFEGFWMQFQAHDMICISRFMWQISWFWPKSRLKR